MFKTPTNVLVVDDEKALVQMIVETLKEVNFSCLWGIQRRKSALKCCSNKNIDVIILDIKMPGMDGMETLLEVKKRFPLVEVIMLTGHGTIETSVEGMKMGAFDYILKPADFDELVLKISAARKKKDQHEERIRKAEAQALLSKSRKGGKKPFGQQIKNGIRRGPKQPSRLSFAPALTEWQRIIFLWQGQARVFSGHRQSEAIPMGLILRTTAICSISWFEHNFDGIRDWIIRRQTGVQRQTLYIRIFIIISLTFSLFAWQRNRLYALVMIVFLGLSTGATWPKYFAKKMPQFYFPMEILKNH